MPSHESAMMGVTETIVGEKLAKRYEQTSSYTKYGVVTLVLLPAQDFR